MLTLFRDEFPDAEIELYIQYLERFGVFKQFHKFPVDTQKMIWRKVFYGGQIVDIQLNRDEVFGISHRPALALLSMSQETRYLALKCCKSFNPPIESNMNSNTLSISPLSMIPPVIISPASHSPSSRKIFWVPEADNILLHYSKKISFNLMQGRAQLLFEPPRYTAPFHHIAPYIQSLKVNHAR